MSGRSSGGSGRAGRPSRLLGHGALALPDALQGSPWRLWRLVGTPAWRFTTRRRARRLARPLGLEHLLYRSRARRFERLERTRSPHGETPRRDRARLLAELRSRTLVFTVTAGRTGTTLVTNLLKLLPDTTALHEPEPAFEHYLRRAQREPASAKDFLLEHKLPAICRYPTANYAELSHVFCKGFLEPMLELGLVPNLIMLRRRPRLVAQSLMERYTIPERTYYGLEFLVGPRDPGTLALPGWRRMSDYQLAFWYALEIERRQRAYAELLARLGGKTFDVTAYELHDPERFFGLAETLGLIGSGLDRGALSDRFHSVAGRRHNPNPFKIAFVGNLDAQEEAVWRAASRTDPTLRSWVERRYT